MSDDAMFGYFGDELEHIKINGRGVDCIPIYNFFALRLQYLEKQTTRLQALTYEQIIFDFWDNDGQLKIPGINSTLIAAYHDLITDYAFKNKRSFKAARDHFSNLDWLTLAVLLDEQLKEWDVFFYAHGSTVKDEDPLNAAKVGILLINSHILAELKELN